jgi:hypothetical protein
VQPAVALWPDLRWWQCLRPVVPPGHAVAGPEAVGHTAPAAAKAAPMSSQCSSLLLHVFVQDTL